MCVFCEIIKGNLTSSRIYEDDKVIAFLDIAQVCLGHTLVVPKQHFDNMLSCDEETLSHLMCVTQRLGKHLMDVCDAKGMNILSNVNELAGQSVPHFHVHLIPRYTSDDACIIRFEKSEPQDLLKLAQELNYKTR